MKRLGIAIPRISLKDPIVMGTAVALTVCLDAYISRWSHVSLLNRFPFLLTLIVSAVVVVALLVFARAGSIARARDTILVGAAFLASQMIGFNRGPIDPLEIVTVVFAVSWLSIALTDRRNGIVVSPVFLAMLGILLFAWLPIIDAWLVLFIGATIAISTKFVLFFLLTQTIRRPATVRTAVGLFIGVAVFAAVAALGQEAVFILTGKVLTLSDDRETLFKMTPFGPLLRATGFSPKPQHLGGFLGFGLPLVLFHLFSPDATRKKKWWLGVATIVICAALVVTLAVGSWLTMAFILLLFPYFRWPSRAIHITVLLACLVMLAVYSGIGPRVYSTLANSGIMKGESQRLYLTQLAFEKLRRNPIIGVGLRQFGYFTLNFRQFPVHNAILQAATEVGILGALLFVGILVSQFCRLAVLLVVRGARPDKDVLKMLLLGLLAIIMGGMSEPTFDHSNTWVCLGFIEAAILSYTRWGAGAERDPARPALAPAVAHG